MSKVEKRNFRLKMNLACGNDDLRPVMHHVYFQDGQMMATDAHILIKANVMAFSDFDKTEVDMLNGKFIHKNTFKKLLSCDQLVITENGIQDCSSKDVYAFAQFNGNYPKFDSVIPKEYKAISEIGISPHVAKKLFQILCTPDLYTLALNFSGENAGITIRAVGDQQDSLTCILMPVMIAP